MSPPMQEWDYRKPDMLEPFEAGRDPNVYRIGLQSSTPALKPPRSDVKCPMTTPSRARAPSIDPSAQIMKIVEDDTRKLSLLAKGVVFTDMKAELRQGLDLRGARSLLTSTSSSTSMQDLPSEVQATVLDYIFGDLRSARNGPGVSQQALKNVSSLMRHPRRKAVSHLALVSKIWRGIVQGRIYRHSKHSGRTAVK